MADNPIVENRSKLKEFLASIATMSGDLSNITAPPFVLDAKSTVEIPAYWAERPSVFVAPAAEKDPAKRALLVLRWFLSSLRNQQYTGRNPEEGAKKPLNAFLGEVFLAKWVDGAGTTRIISEQVNHHPPVTASRVWNEKHGVSAEGFTRQEVTFSGFVNVKQTGYALLKIAPYDETYLIPLPNMKVKGILSGTPYPEISGSYDIPCTNGYICSIDFAGQSFLGFGGGDKNTFKAKVYEHGKKADPVYRVEGSWIEGFSVKDERSGQQIEAFQHEENEVTPFTVDPIDEQDPWETRRAWKGVRDALDRSDMQGVADAKNKLEQGQRAMRKEEGDGDGKNWKRLLFRAEQTDAVAAKLWDMLGEKFNAEETIGLWKFDQNRWKDGIKKPLRGDTQPDNTTLSSGDKSQRMGSIVGGKEATDNDRRESSVGINRRGVLSLGEAGQRQPRHYEPEKDVETPQSQSRSEEPQTTQPVTRQVNPPLQEKSVDQISPEPKKPSTMSKLISSATHVFQKDPSPPPTEDVKADEVVAPAGHAAIAPTTAGPTTTEPAPTNPAPVASSAAPVTTETTTPAPAAVAGSTATQAKSDSTPLPSTATAPIPTEPPHTQIETEGVVHPPLPEHAQQKERDEAAQEDSGIEGMTVSEKGDVEDMLRNMYSTRGKAR